MAAVDLDHLGNLERRLAELRSSQKNIRNEDANLLNMKTERYYVAVEKPYDPVEETIQAYMKKEFKIGVISNKFADLGNITADFRQVKLDFPDNTLFGQPGIEMVRIGVEEAAAIGRKVIPMVASGFSKSGAAAIFLLAYNITIPNRVFGEYLFPPLEGVTGIQDIADKKHTEFSDRVMTSSGLSQVMVDFDDHTIEAIVYCYLATTMLRIFTKSPGNYVRAWSHILGGIKKFYNIMELDRIQLPTPSEAAIKGLADWFALEPRAKQTLYRLLYLGGENKLYHGFKRFLYDMHLMNTGMHLASMFVALSKILNCRSGLLLQAINVRRYERQVDCLVSLLKLIQNNDTNHIRGIWRFGRIFDETFMADIQTRACPKLVYVFAAALKSEAPQTYNNVHQIAQLRDVSDVSRTKCSAVAQKLLQAIREYNTQVQGNQRTSRRNSKRSSSNSSNSIFKELIGVSTQ